MTHGYSAYTHGCRCDTCRKAKADYMRDLRAAARTKAQKHTFRPPGVGAFGVGSTRYVSTTATHGTRYGYDGHGCRCYDCTQARMDSDARVYRNRQAKEKGGDCPYGPDCDPSEEPCCNGCASGLGPCFGPGYHLVCLTHDQDQGAPAHA